MENRITTGKEFVEELAKRGLSLEYKREFELSDGLVNIVFAYKWTKENYDIKLNNTTQDLGDVKFYAKDYFCPKSLTDGVIRKTKNTYTIHHFSGSWKKKSSKFKAKLLQFIKRILGEKNVQKLKEKRNKKNESSSSSSK